VHDGGRLVIVAPRPPQAACGLDHPADEGAWAGCNWSAILYLLGVPALCPASCGWRRAMSRGAGMSWDVFVSHNRKDKAWVRVFVQHLRELGLRVFFDEDSISVGGEFHREVSEALEQSQAFVFIITAASTLSPWVDDEIDMALSYRAASKHQLKVIPVYLESVRFDHPGVKTSTPIYLTEGNQRNILYRQLLHGLAPNSDPAHLDSLAESLPWPGTRRPSDSLKINNGGKALAIGAHWDDILLGCLGTLLRLQLHHDYTVSVAVLCNAYADSYYGLPQEELPGKIHHIYRELEQRFAIRSNSPSPGAALIPDRCFREKEDRVDGVLDNLAQSFGDCDLIFSTAADDGHVDHAVTGRLVQSHFRRPEQTILDYEVKRYTDRSFVPNIFIDLDSPSPDGASLGDLKVLILSDLVVNGNDLQGSAVPTGIVGSDHVFGRQSLEARLLINALDYSGNKRIRYGEVFRGRVSI
jgi:TIR domain/GlcNAc-PI de-N-acetylase